MFRLLLCLQNFAFVSIMMLFLAQCTNDEETTDLTDPVSEVDDEDLFEDGLMAEDGESSILDEGMEIEEVPFVETPAANFEGGQPIYFNFDDHSVTPDAEGELAKMASYLKENLQFSLEVEGHCDERGTTEYNLALGEKRALSVKNFLVELGVEESRVAVTSYGEEKPAVMGSDEFAWGQNRRVEFVLRQE